LNQKEFSFKKLESADLQADALYIAEKSSNLDEGSLSKIMRRSNQGGFRIVGDSRVHEYKLVH